MKKIVYIIGAILLLGHGLYAQVEQVRYGTSQGAKWTSGGIYTNFGIAGQSSIATQISGGNYTGNIGFMFYADAQSAINEAPIAFDDRTNFYLELSDKIELTGVDPEGALIEFVINTSASQLNVVQEGINGELLSFSPKNNLVPDQVYNDSIKFIVREVESGLESEIATILFQFILEDTPHYVAAFDRAASDFTVQFVDTVKNENYSLDINYYDLSDINNPVFVPIFQSEVLIGDFAVSNDTLSYTFSVDANVHDHLFNASQVFTTVLITGTNGYSDFASYMIDNSSGAGKSSGSEDGQFWVIGSEQTVPENKTVILNMMAIEFADFDMTNATIDILSDASKGEIGSVTQTQEEASLISWEIPYTSTQDVGGLDSLLFRVFHPGRNLFDSTYVKVKIIDVNDPPSIDDLLDKQMQEDGILTVDVDYSDPDNSLAVTVSSNESSNISVSETDGVITVTPSQNFNGTASITVSVKELNTTEEFVVVESFDLDIISSNDPPLVAAVSNQQVDEDNVVNIVLNATDPDTDLLLFDYFAASDDPGIANVSITDNLLSITPEENANGVVVITVQADDRTGSENSLSENIVFNVDFQAVNDVPEVSSLLGTQVLVEDFPGYDIHLEDNFFDAETAATSLTYSVSGNTNVGVSFVGSVATITPTGGFFGNEDLTFNASDGAESVDMLVAFIVNQKNADINVVSALSTANLEEDFGTHVIDVSGVFDDINNIGEVFTYSVAGNSTLNYIIDDLNETITFTSVEDFSGNESLLLIGTTSGKSSYTSLDLTIAAVNDAPSIKVIADQNIFEDGGFENLFLDISDVDHSLNNLTVSAVSNNQSIILDASVVITQTNGYYYLSASPLINQFGSVDITVSVSDGSLSDQQSFTVQINAVNDLPEGTAVVASDAIEDVDYSVMVANLFNDNDGDILTYTVENKPEWLSFVNNELSGTPSNDEVGSYTMQITATDPFDAAYIETYTFSVANVNDAPMLTSSLPDLTVLQENAFGYLFPAASFDDVDEGDILTYSVEKYPSWATLSNNNLSGVPQYENIGSDTIIIKAMDVAGLFVVDTIIVTTEFTVYDVAISVTDATICLGETGSVTASGAIDYNWYDVDGNLLQSGGASFISDSSTSTEVSVEGLDSKGRPAPNKVTTIITINPLPDVTLTETETDLSVLESANASYQWFFNNVAIIGAEASTYTPDKKGDYFVQVINEFTCSAKSEAVAFIITGLELGNYSLEVYPNPTYDYLHVSGRVNLSELTFDVIDISGKLFRVPVIYKTDKVMINTGLLKGGEYVLRIKTKDSAESVRFIKQ